MEKQNVTFSLPKNLLKKAKTVAARRDISLNELIRVSLEESVREATDYNRARERQIKLIKKGLNLGTKGSLSFSREELHVRQ